MVVIGRNEGERLVRCLESVHQADYPRERLELIYVDSDSTDGSCAAAGRLGAQVIALAPERPTAGAARNAGFRAATHDLVQFLDGDTVLDPEWLHFAVPAIQAPEVACVFGRVEEIAPKANIYTFWAHHDWFVLPGPSDTCGGIALFRKCVLMQAGGFDESLIAGEERELCCRMMDGQEMTILCLDRKMVLHDIDMRRFRQYWLRCCRTGHAYAELSNRRPGLGGMHSPGRSSLYHVAALVIALGLSIVLWSPWPIATWAGLIVTAILRAALRCRKRVGSLRGGLLYSLHLYLAKLPIALGQFDYWSRCWFSRLPRKLIEYKDDPQSVSRT
ncbi:MAG: glycosyltransferase family 2 protein [Planctomycetes bacterium]|nr:glycosyltransferase family 2 protein [Planctomycetota bacterium]